MPSSAACRLASVTRSGAGARVAMRCTTARRGPLVLRQSILLQLVVERGAVDLKPPRGLRLVASRIAHRVGDQVALECLHLLAKRWTGVRHRTIAGISDI